MTGTFIDTHARKISSFVLSGIIALFFITSGCESNADETLARKTQPAQPVTPVAVTSSPVVTPPPAPESEIVEVVEPRAVSYADAEAAFNEKNYGEAVNLFSRYTEQKSANPWGHYMLGLSAYRVGDYETAKTSYETALSIDPDHVKSWINLSRALLAAGDTDGAITALDSAITIDPESVDIYRLQGRAFDNQDLHPEAIASYKQALILDDKDAWSMNNLALVYIEEEQFDSALPVLALAVETNNTQSLFFNNLGMVLEHHGQVIAAVEAYQQAVTLDPANQKAIDNLARIKSVKQRVDLEPIDIAEQAATFRAELETWKSFGEDVKGESLGDDSSGSEYDDYYNGHYEEW